MFIVKFQIKNQCLHVHIYMYINCPKKVTFEAKLTMHIRTALIKQKSIKLKDTSIHVSSIDNCQFAGQFKELHVSYAKQLTPNASIVLYV